MNSFKRKLKKVYIYSRELILLIVLYPISHWWGKNKKIYLFSERGYEARDNGLYMYRYFKEKHPEKQAYYVIGKGSEDMKNVEKYGNLIYHNSIKHHILFYAAKYCISTHIFGYTPNIDFYAHLIRRGNFKDKIKISVKHGIDTNNIVLSYAEYTCLDLRVAGAKPEYDFVLENFHYTDKQVKYTGLARFDGLHKFKTANQILVMPTWRKYLYQLSKKDFVNSQYYREWSSFLLSKHTAELLEKYDTKIVFYPHYELQKYIDLFKSESDRIIIADKEHYDVQTLLKESKLLITDFSSVYFDFAYMKKPLIYYQFDKEKFHSEHYGKGYFVEETMGFGDVVYDLESLFSSLEKSLKKDCKMEDIYSNRVGSFFELHDDKNCERIYDEIMKL